MLCNSVVQGDNQQQSEGDGGSGAQLRQLQPAAAQRGAGRAEQQHGGLPDGQVALRHTHTRAHTHHGLFSICPTHSRPHSFD